MANGYPPFEFGQFYHVYNRGNNGENIFRENDNYGYFLSLYEKHIAPVAYTYAWCLMPNHFHLLVRIKDEEVALESISGFGSRKAPEYRVSQSFSNFFNAYAKAFNKRYGRHGSLFEKPVRRIAVNSDEYLKRLVYYIHANPVKHGFAHTLLDYPWSSYLTLVSVKPTKLSRDHVLGWFDSDANFVEYHDAHHDLEIIKREWLED